MFGLSIIPVPLKPVYFYSYTSLCTYVPRSTTIVSKKCALNIVQIYFILIINGILSFWDLTVQSTVVEVQTVGRVPRFEKHYESSIVNEEIKEIFDMCTLLCLL